MLLFEILVIVLFLDRDSPLGLSLNKSHYQAVPHEQLQISVNHKNEDSRFLKKTYVEEDVIPEPDIESNLYPRGEKMPLKFLSGSNDDHWIADIREMPSYVAIIIKNYFCGGNLISKINVLTVATCVTETYLDEITQETTYKLHDADIISLRIGSSFIQTGGISYVYGISVHPDFMKNKSLLHYKDVAVVHLLRNEILSVNIAPAGVHPFMTVEDITKMKGTSCYIGQWAIVPEGGYRLVIRKLKLSSFHFCEKVHKERTNENEHICSESNSSPPCRITMGSCVVCNSKILAVVSWNQNCTSGKPILLTRVDNARDFIISVSSASSQMTLLFTILITSLIN